MSHLCEKFYFLKVRVLKCLNFQGKQPLTVQGPRLNSTKEQKCSKTPLYMKDSRLTVKIVSKQPKLKLATFPFPETLYQGEVQVIDVQFENVGNAPMSEIYLIHHSPGMFSFGNSPHQHAKRKDTLFDLPLHSRLFSLKMNFNLPLLVGKAD